MKKLLLFSLLLPGLLVALPREGSTQALLQLPGTASANMELVQKISRSATIIHKHYYDPARIDPLAMMDEGMNAIAKQIPEVIVSISETAPHQMTVSFGEKKQVISFGTLTRLHDMLIPVAAALAFIRQHYQGELKVDDFEYTFLGGMLRKLDPHSTILTPEDFQEFQTQTSGEYGGIGIVVGLKDEDLTVIAPMEATPATRAGLKKEDKILEIDSLPTTNMPLSEAVDRLRGKIGSSVTLRVGRENHDTFEVTITREQINIVSVRSKLLSENNKRVGILSIRSFQENTFADMAKALDEMTAGNQPLDGLIMDLRNNPGGLLDESIEMVDKFIEQGNILFTVGAENSDEDITRAHKGGDIISPPMIVLVNEGSASASEIVAGALKNNNRALVIGAQTFGKGSVQSIFGLQGGGAMKMTVAQYLTPGRVSIQAVGIVPDVSLVPVYVTPELVDLKVSDHFGEKNLEEHLENKSRIKSEESWFALPYLNGEVEELESEYTMGINEKTDYPLGLALRLINTVTSNDKEQMKKESLPQLLKEAKNQDELIVVALQKNKVDWTAAAEPIKQTINLKCDSKFTDKATTQAVAIFNPGTEIIWEMSCTNQDQIRAWRLIGIVEAENALLDKKEFVFGSIKTGEKGKAQINVKIPEDMLAFRENIMVNFYAGQDQKVYTTQIPTQFTEKARLSLGYQFEFKDDGTLGSKGNGNHKVEKGETIAVVATIHNKSGVEAGNVSVNLKNLEGDGVFLRKARDTLKSLKPSEEKQALFLFEVAPGYAKDNVKLDLAIFDRPTRSGFVDQIIFDLKPDATSPVKPLPATEYTAPFIVVNQHRISDSEVEVSGLVEDDQAISDVMVFAGDKKVFYKAGSPTSPTKKIEFTQKIALKEGANYIVVQARDDRQLVTNHTLSIIGKDKADLAKKESALKPGT